MSSCQQGARRVERGLSGERMFAALGRNLQTHLPKSFVVQQKMQYPYSVLYESMDLLVCAASEHFVIPELSDFFLSVA